jgi:hypothetical protein
MTKVELDAVAMVNHLLDLHGALRCENKIPQNMCGKFVDVFLPPRGREPDTSTREPRIPKTISAQVMIGFSTAAT